MVKPRGASFLEVIPLITHHLPLNHLTGFANGYCLKLVMLSREKGSKFANLAVHRENEERKALVSECSEGPSGRPALSRDHLTNSVSRQRPPFRGLSVELLGS